MEYSYYITPTEYNLALSNGVSNRNLVQRVRNCGWSIEKACNEPLQHQYTKKNVTDEMRAILKSNNISMDMYKNRILIRGWDKNRALNTPPLTKSEVMAIKDKATRKISLESYDIAHKNGLTNKLVIKRVYAGWALERAITTPRMTRHECAVASKTKSYTL